MSDLHLDDQLLKQLEQLAAKRSMDVNEFLKEAVLSYLRDIEQDAMQENIKAYAALYPELLKIHKNDYVAIYQGELVDHDRDFQALHRRIRSRYGRQPVLLRKVSAEAERIWTVRSPRISRPARWSKTGNHII